MTVTWIDIEKSLPAYNDEVLLCVRGGALHDPLDLSLTLGKRVSTTKDGEQFSIAGHVTHWAPKPELAVDEKASKIRSPAERH